jgi:hypothetical protein
LKKSQRLEDESVLDQADAGRAERKQHEEAAKMKKLLFAFVILTLCLPAAFAARVGTVTGDRVPVWAGHDTKSEILGEVNSGVVFEILDTYQSEGEPYPWYQGAWIGEVHEGWIYGQFVSEEESEEKKYANMWTHRVQFDNLTNATISLAIACEAADGGDNGKPGAIGWYNIEPGTTANVIFSVNDEAIGPGRPARCRYYAKSGNTVWGGAEGQNLGYMIHPTKDFWCAYGDQGIYGEAGGEKYDLGKGQREPKGCEYVPFKDLPKDEGFYVGVVKFE